MQRSANFRNSSLVISIVEKSVYAFWRFWDITPCKHKCNFHPYVMHWETPNTSQQNKKIAKRKILWEKENIKWSCIHFGSSSHKRKFKRCTYRPCLGRPPDKLLPHLIPHASLAECYLSYCKHKMLSVKLHINLRNKRLPLQNHKMAEVERQPWRTAGPTVLLKY